MKRLIVLGMLGVIGWMPYQASAQLSINVNIGSQPLWGPVGYDHVDNYYLPDIECYYNVPNRQFIYLQGSRWIFSASLPSRYSGYNLYNGYKVVVNSRDAYRNFSRDRVTYARYKHTRGQQIIRYSNDSRYDAVRGHSHGQPKKYYSRDNDNGRGHSSDHDRGHDRSDHGGHDDHGHGRGRH